MKNPIEIIGRTRKRLAHLAAIETLIRASLPISLTLAVALLLDVINRLAFAKLGYYVEPNRAALLWDALCAVVLVELGLTAIFGWRAWVRASGFLGAAERIDSRVGGRQEILTLATLADPAHLEAARTRSALFPMLWQRVLAYLDRFEPRREFKLEFREPLQRSAVLAVIAALLLTGATIGVMTIPDPVETAALRLRQIANSSGASPTARQFAMAADDVARDLENPGLPPEQKIAELQALKQQLERSQQQNHPAQSGNGNSSGGNSGKGNGGSGNGRGSGSGQGNGPGQGSASSGGGAPDKGESKSNGQQTVELRNDISKAQAMLEQQSGDKSQLAANGSKQGPGIAPKSGNNPNQPGNQNQPNGTGGIQLPQPSALADNKMPSGGSPRGRNDQGSTGDTHLGEFPKASNYQRFYKLGEGGPAINIRDARYVTFRLPSEVASGGGSLVSDTARPTATTPYTNAPLKEERYPVTTDEQQLVPPRYRELIR